MSLLKKLISYPTKSASSDLLIGITLDLSYISDSIIVCSFPSSQFPSNLYRNDVDDLVNFLEIKYPGHWNVWNLRAESALVDNHRAQKGDINLLKNFKYFPWIDHESPPFTLLIEIIESLANYLRKDSKNVAVVHCKLGKGRSGLVVVAYFIKELKMGRLEAQNLFTAKRMKSGFGEGVSILSQKRYLRYVELANVLDFKEHDEYLIDFIKVINPQFSTIKGLRVAIRSYLDGSNNCELSNELIADDFTFFRAGDQEICVLRFLQDNQGLLKQDIKLSFNLNTRMHNLIDMPLSTAYLWFNTFWENYSNIVPNKKCSFKWSEFDGFKGTSKKGTRLFDEIEIYLSKK